MEKNNKGHSVVADAGTHRYMMQGSVVQSCMDMEARDLLVLKYTRYAPLPFVWREGIRGVLVLGGGGYMIQRTLLTEHPDITIDTVEIDPEATRLAREYFFLEEDSRHTIYHEDAAAHIAASAKEYDYIIQDTFIENRVPQNVRTKAHFANIAARTSRGGLFMLNLIAPIEGDPLFRRTLRDIKRAFAFTRVFTVEDEYKPRALQNLVIYAAHTPFSVRGTEGMATGFELEL